MDQRWLPNGMMPDALGRVKMSSWGKNILDGTSGWYNGSAKPGTWAPVSEDDPATNQLRRTWVITREACSGWRWGGVHAVQQGWRWKPQWKPQWREDALGVHRGSRGHIFLSRRSEGRREQRRLREGSPSLSGARRGDRHESLASMSPR